MSVRKPAGERVLEEALSWPMCTAELIDCQGVQLDDDGRCLAHAEPGSRTNAFGQLAVGAPLDFARGVPFTGELLDELLDHAPTNGHNETVLRNADFTRAVLLDCSFYRVVFHNPVRFNEAAFEGNVDFRRTSFDADVGFRNAVFAADARFSEAVFGEGEAGFAHASFEGHAKFDAVRFGGEAFFNDAAFEQDVWFYMASFANGVTFQRARFTQAVELGPMASARTIAFDDAVFSHPVQLEVAAWGLSCERTRFLAGGHVRVAGTAVSLTGAAVPAPLILAHHPPELELVELVGANAAGQLQHWRQVPPKLVSVQRADVAGLVLADFDLRECRFAGAHHLDAMRFATADAFHRAPGPWRSGRQVLAEECAWRQSLPGRRGRRWRSAVALEDSRLVLEDYGSDGQLRQPGLAELAGIYRDLRKGREAAKNEPGAASFYYGECEMRRRAPETPPVERWLLTGYWLVSGYGLRAWRALTALTALVLLAAIALDWGGFVTPADPSLASVLVFTAQSVVSLETKLASLGTSVALTAPGELVRLAVRILGPVLLALALLAIRNRIKR